MHPVAVTVVLGILVGVQAQILLPARPQCDSPLVEEAAVAARNHLNAQHTHGYKYELNRIEDVKVYTEPNGVETYVLEVDLLETDCHALDPTPLANCTVRPKHLTAVEGDCDVVLKKVGGALTVTAFKCKTEASTEDLCLGCYTLLPLNDTGALNFIHASLATFNNNTVNATYDIYQIGRMSSQIVSGGPQYLTEYVISEVNCTGGNCVPLDEATVKRGLCRASGRSTAHNVDCKIFPNLTPLVDANATGPAVPPVIHAHNKHGFGHHKLTPFHNPHLSTHLSAESPESESAEMVQAAPKAAAPAADAAAPAVDAAAPAVDAAAPAVDAAPAAPAAAEPAVALETSDSMEVNPRFMFKREVVLAAPVHAPLPPPPCPGRVRFFK
ncbi:alpha-2-HS-glycoprotein 2 [Betta splendens]|uniref:Alpha-2-HS-glycoprotein 2 n=1 Tax=Betta splendens TaxID=158456 RepID=A0A6P7L410_BETSP|nr:alpha-2-HS-glycoprotein 2 [Betta splendens]